MLAPHAKRLVSELSQPAVIDSSILSVTVASYLLGCEDSHHLARPILGEKSQP